MDLMKGTKMEISLEGNRSEAFGKYSNLNKQLDEIKALITVQAISPILSKIKISDFTKREIKIEKEMDALWWKLDEDERKFFDPSNEKQYNTVALSVTRKLMNLGVHIADTVQVLHIFQVMAQPYGVVENVDEQA